MFEEYLKIFRDFKIKEFLIFMNIFGWLKIACWSFWKKFKNSAWTF
jgi:hypothetical protein